MTYSEKLKDPRWQRKRLEILDRDKFACQKCADTTTTLHVHHRRYIPSNEPWEYDEIDLITLCAPCHEEETDLWKREMHELEQVLVIRGYFASDVRDLIIRIYGEGCIKSHV